MTGSHQTATEGEAHCPSCPKTFQSMKGVRVHHTKVHDSPLNNRICERCGTGFYDPKSTRKHCDDCLPEYQDGRANPNWRDAKETTSCDVCETTFEYYPSEKSGRFCPSCVDDDAVSCTPEQDHWGEGRTEVSCSHCDSSISVYNHKVERNDDFFCDRECYRKWLSDAYRSRGKWSGDDNPNWRNGVDQEGLYGNGWPTARRKALQRAHYECQRCGKDAEEIGRNPDVHHIVPVREFDDPADAHVLENLVALCRPCHIAVEREGADLFTKN